MVAASGELLLDDIKQSQSYHTQRGIYARLAMCMERRPGLAGEGACHSVHYQLLNVQCRAPAPSTILCRQG